MASFNNILQMVVSGFKNNPSQDGLLNLKNVLFNSDFSEQKVMEMA